MKKRILITGARAPVALELSRQFSKAGNEVFVADSVRFPLTRASRHVKKSFLLPPPRTKLNAFITALISIIKTHHIDLLIPTCEEVFYIARHLPTLNKYCQVFCDSFDKLALVHSKFNFLTAAADCGAYIPQSFKLESINDLHHLSLPVKDLVFKPEFSRFASHIMISPSNAELKSLTPTKQSSWIAQQRIRGKEYCSYSIANNGKVSAHACYHPKYRVGLGSGVYFEPHNNEAVLDFTRRFVAKNNFHGQIGFDFIEAESGQLFVLECNPRATSGAHLFAESSNLAHKFFDDDTPLLVAHPEKPYMIAPAIVIFNALNEFKNGRGKELLQHFRLANDICFTMNDPLPQFYQFLGLFEIIFRSMTRGVGLKDAATSDIEWNGETLR